MSTENNKITIQTVGITNILVFLAFFFAKIYDKIDWSWWLVFSPLWIPLAVLILILVIACIVIAIRIIKNC